MDNIDWERTKISKKLNALNNRCSLFDKDTVEYVHNEITRLEINNWDIYHNETEYAKGKNMAYRECARILTTKLNNRQFKPI
jgi:hypothetical protein